MRRQLSKSEGEPLVAAVALATLKQAQTRSIDEGHLAQIERQAAATTPHCLSERLRETGRCKRVDFSSRADDRRVAFRVNPAGKPHVVSSFIRGSLPRVVFGSDQEIHQGVAGQSKHHQSRKTNPTIVSGVWYVLRHLCVPGSFAAGQTRRRTR